MTHGYRTYADFEREELRPGMRVGWSLDEVDAAVGRGFGIEEDPFDGPWARLDASDHDD